MTLKIPYCIILLMPLFFSCGEHAVNFPSQANSHDTNRIIKDTIAKDADRILPSVTYFRQSTCTKDCRDAERLFSIQLKGDSLYGRLGITHYCNQKMKMTAAYSNDTLRLNINQPGTTYTDKNGKTHSIETITFCYCYYYFDFGIKHINNVPAIILVNDKLITETKYDGAHSLKTEEPAEEPPASDTNR